MKKKATFAEIINNWTINDLADCHEAMDIEEDIENFFRKQAEAERNK